MIGWIVLGIVLFVLFILIFTGLRLIGPDEVGILTKKIFGKKMLEG
jgi:hypothetical protein